MDFSTHAHGGCVDLVITRDDSGPVTVILEPSFISDHGLLTYSIPFLHSAPQVTQVTFRIKSEVAGQGGLPSVSKSNRDLPLPLAIRSRHSHTVDAFGTISPPFQVIPVDHKVREVFSAGEYTSVVCKESFPSKDLLRDTDGSIS